MAYRKVLYTLQDVFPQIDLRILKAVANEYSSDIDVAVEFVLSDVLPLVNEPMEPHYTLHDNDPAELNATNSGNDTSGSHFGSSCTENPVERSVELEENTNPSKKLVEKSVPDIFAEHAANAFKTFSSVELDWSLDYPEVSKEQTKSIAELLDHSASSGQALYSYAPLADMNSKPKTIHNPSAFSINIWEPSSLSTEVDPCLQETKEFHDLCNSEAYDNVLEASNSGGKSLLPSIENCANSTKYGAGEDVCHDRLIGTHEQERSTDANGSVGELWASTQSGQIPEIDCINKHISDMTKSKDKLSSALELTIVKKKDVEIHEENARQAKEASDVAGQDILAMVEDYDQKIKSARESNEKQSGEVCMAKSLLVAECQELRSRLMNMSVQKDMFLSVIDEINQTLNARLTAAMEEEAAAKQELAVKDKLARQTLKEKEAVMAKTVDESSRLQVEAEENTKLRELLLDCGHIVDILQKEVSVICRDVASLNERVNGKVALPKRSPPASSSTIHSVSLSDGASSPLVMENPTMVGKEFSQSRTTEDTADDHHKASPDDDDWEIF